MFFFKEFKNNSFIIFCILIYSVLLISGFNLHLSPDFIFSGTSFDIRLLVMFLIAEPHFAMTIPLLYGYKKNFTIKPNLYILVPLVILVIGSLMFFYMNSLFMLLFLVANIFHVNRQSGGFLMIQGKPPFSIKFLYEISLHLFTFLCLYLSIFMQYHSLALGLMVFIFTISIMLIIFKIRNNFWPTFKQSIVMAQGYLIFLPLIVFSDMLLAFAIGISIHYFQYLSIGWRVCKIGFGYSIFSILIIILSYSALSSAALSGFLTTERVSIFILIPTMVQLLHFYYDSLIWRRGDPVIGNTLAKAL